MQVQAGVYTIGYVLHRQPDSCTHALCIRCARWRVWELFKPVFLASSAVFLFNCRCFSKPWSGSALALIRDSVVCAPAAVTNVLHLAAAAVASHAAVASSLVALRSEVAC
jgi:hypothetical protein